MELDMKDLNRLMETDEKTILSYIKEKNMPAYKIDNEYRFYSEEIKAWILENNIKVSEKFLEMDSAHAKISLVGLLSRGGIFYDVAGKSASEVIRNAVSFINLPVDLTREKLVYTLLKREELTPTAVGRGIALPHPREPIIADPKDESVSICFLKDPIDFHALDHAHVHTLFLILSSNPQRHLEMLSRISFLCQEDLFHALLEKRAPENEIIDHVMMREIEWNA